MLSITNELVCCLHQIMRITALAKIQHSKARSTCPADLSYRPFTPLILYHRKAPLPQICTGESSATTQVTLSIFPELIRVLLSGKQFVRSDLKMALKRTKVGHDNTETTEDIPCSSSAQEVGVQDFKRYTGHSSPKLVSARHP